MLSKSEFLTLGFLSDPEGACDLAEHWGQEMLIRGQSLKRTP